MRVLLGMVLGIAVVVAGVFLYFKLGFAPVATAAPPMPFETPLAEMALRARMTREAPSQAPIPPDETNLAAGARIYRESCAVCHGLRLRGESETAIARGMFPKPPQLFQGKGVTDDPVGLTYWKVKNGIRLTGMPGFSQSMTDQQLWQVSLMLAQRDKLPESMQKLLSEPAPVAGPLGTPR
jgi:thiosulfate dehydrogenase